MLHYSFPIDIAIKALKFRRKLFYGPAFAEVLCVAKPLLPAGIDAVLPVPLHWRRKAVRGFNQAMETAQPIAKSLGVPLVRNVQRKKATPFQSGLDAAERARNLRRAFMITRPHTYTHILVIDDVVTTGATSEALATLLLSSGVTKVSFLAVARAGQTRLSMLGDVRIEGVVQHNADEDDHADVMVMQKGSKAPGRLPVTGEPKVVGHQQAGQQYGQVIPEA